MSLNVRDMQITRNLILIVLGALLLQAPGYALAANCANPSKPEGTTIYNTDYHTPQYCNGTSWISWAPINTSTGPQTIFLTAGTSWTVPADWNSANNTIEVIGGGGGGGGGNGTQNGEGDGGSGGGYSIKNNATLTPGATVTVAVGAGGTGGTAGSGTDGADTYLCNSTSNCASIAGTAVIVGAKGGSRGYGDGSTWGQPGLAASGVGDTKASGGRGGKGSTWYAQGGGGGGGGAAGPNGNGGSGGNCNCTGGVGDTRSGGGGGANGGSAGANGPSTAIGGAGGNNRLGTGGGANANPGGAGTAGGGGGGSNGQGSSSANNKGGAGSQDTLWTQTSDSAAAGPGGGGGGGSDKDAWQNPGQGGAAGGYGAGGGGGLDNTGGAGTQGIIVVKYTPSSSSCGVTSGLVSYWKFDEGSGSTGTDSQGGNNGTLANSPTWITGKVGGAITLNGGDQYMNVPLTAGLRTATCSTAAWVKLTNDDDEALIGFTKASGGNGYVYSIELGANSDGTLANPLIEAFWFDNGTYNADAYVTATRSQLFDGNWHHLVVTEDGSATKIYLDGTVRSTTPASLGSNPGNCTANGNLDSMNIGSVPYGGNPDLFYQGSIDDMRFYNRALSGSEVTALYNGGSGCSD